jgi:hypothetical protein
MRAFSCSTKTSGNKSRQISVWEAATAYWEKRRSSENTIYAKRPTAAACASPPLIGSNYKTVRTPPLANESCRLKDGSAPQNGSQYLLSETDSIRAE